MRNAAGSGVQVQLSVRRGREAISFYRDAFGAVEVFRFEGDGEVVAQLAVGETVFWVEDESPEHDNFSPETLGGATERLLLVVDDPEEVFERALTLGARQVRPIEEAHGWLLGRVADPFGHHWEIARPLGSWPPSDEEVGL
ncbi:MAG TPA: VOC family protein [Acidimicrobiales bacterium]|jgi:PhnB protein